MHILLQGTLTYAISSIFIVCLAVCVLKLESSVKAQIAIASVMFAILLPAIMLVRFIRGESRMGKKRASMDPVRQVQVAMLILLLTYWFYAQVVAEEKKQKRQNLNPRLEIARQNRTAPFFKRWFSILDSTVEDPVEDRLIGHLLAP